MQVENNGARIRTVLSASVLPHKFKRFIARLQHLQFVWLMLFVESYAEEIRIGGVIVDHNYFYRFYRLRHPHCPLPALNSSNFVASTACSGFYKPPRRIYRVSTDPA